MDSQRVISHTNMGPPEICGMEHVILSIISMAPLMLQHGHQILVIIKFVPSIYIVHNTKLGSGSAAYAQITMSGNIQRTLRGNGKVVTHGSIFSKTTMDKIQQKFPRDKRKCRTANSAVNTQQEGRKPGSLQ